MNKPRSLKIISYICLYVASVAESARFYSEILCLEPANKGENPDTSTWYSFNTGQTILALERNGIRKDSLKTKAENPTLLQFVIESPEELEKFNQHLEENKVELFDRSKQTDYGFITNFCDPDGNKLELICQI
jgi:catechol 2,3-dioxygenase-like lactoylglutathione lyase family enzyme